MPRLSFAIISVLAHAVAQETRITDPAAAASEGNAQLHELIKAEYLAEACEDPRRDRRLNRLNVLSPRPSPGGTVAIWLMSRPFPLSFVLDVVSTSIVSVRTTPRGPRK